MLHVSCCTFVLLLMKWKRWRWWILWVVLCSASFSACLCTTSKDTPWHWSCLIDARQHALSWNHTGKSGHVRRPQGDKGQKKSAISGRRLHWILWIFSSGFFSFLSRSSVQFSKEIAPKCRENCPISGQRKKRRILSRLWLSGLFRSRQSPLFANPSPPWQPIPPWLRGCTFTPLIKGGGSKKILQNKLNLHPID